MPTIAKADDLNKAFALVRVVGTSGGFSRTRLNVSNFILKNKCKEIPYFSYKNPIKIIHSYKNQSISPNYFSLEG